MALSLCSCPILCVSALAQPTTRCGPMRRRSLVTDGPYNPLELGEWTVHTQSDCGNPYGHAKAAEEAEMKV